MNQEQYVRDVAKQMGRKFQDSIFLNDNPSAAIGIIRRVRQMCQRCPKDTTLAKLEAQSIREDKG